MTGRDVLPDVLGLVARAKNNRCGSLEGLVYEGFARNRCRCMRDKIGQIDQISLARHASDGAAYLLGENYPRRSCICRGVLIRGGHHFHSPLSGFAGAGGCSNDGPRRRRHPSGPTSVGPMRGYARPARSMVAPKAKHWGLPALALHWSLPFPG